MRKLPKTAASEVREIAIRAYFYLFPLVLMDITRRQVTKYRSWQDARPWPHELLLSYPRLPRC
jgi:hypothetical protein